MNSSNTGGVSGSGESGVIHSGFSGFVITRFIGVRSKPSAWFNNTIYYYTILAIARRREGERVNDRYNMLHTRKSSTKPCSFLLILLASLSETACGFCGKGLGCEGKTILFMTAIQIGIVFERESGNLLV